MANTNIDNSKKISELATTTNVASSDRVLVLYNAAGNAAIANGTPQARTITVNNFAGFLGNNLPVISTNIIPATDNTYSLGNSSYQWKSLYVSANTIFIGGTPLSISNGTLVVNSATFVSVSSPTDFTLQAGYESYSFGANGVLTVPNGITIGATLTVNGAVQSANVIVSAKTQTYTLTANDSGTTITVSNTGATTITVPASLPVGFRCRVMMINTGNVVIGNSTGVTLNSRTNNYTVSSQWGSASVFVYAANSVIVDGSI